MKKLYFCTIMCKNTIFLFVLAACFVLPMKAQQSDGFFRKEALYENRDGAVGGYNVGTQGFGSDVNGGYNIGTQQFGQELPLDEGLLVMAAAGACYAARKRKKTLDLRL